MADEEKEVGGTGVEIPEETELDIENRLRVSLQKEYDTRLEVELQKIQNQLQKENEKVVKEALERYRKEMLPPTEQDVQKLLEQEYVEFKMEIRVPQKDGEEKYISKTFVIQELPQKVEKKIFKKIREVLTPFSEDLAALSMKFLEGDASKKIVQLMNTFEPMLTVMGGIAAICLNPYGEDEDITEEWVIEHLSSTRIVKVVMAQVEANHMRDFFSLLFQGSKLLK
jgi:hypothetical protein